MNERAPTKVQISTRNLAAWPPGARWLVFSFALVFTLAARVNAQEPAGGNQSWSLGLSANELSETDSSQPGAANSGSQASQFNANVSHDWVLHRGGISLTSNASQYFYNLNNQSAPATNQFAYGLGLSASYAVSPRLSWNVSDNLSSAYARDTTTLLVAGLLPPKVVTRFNTVASGLGYDLSARTRIRWGVSEQNVSLGSSLFAGSSTLGTSIGIFRQLTRVQTVGVTADYSRTVSDGTIGTVGGLSASWQRPIGSAFTVIASGGVRGYTVPGRGLRLDPTGTIGVNFNAHIVHNDTFGVHYDRTVSQELGLGSLQTFGVSATYGLSIGSRLGLSGMGGYVRGSSPLDPNHPLTGRNGGVFVRYALFRGLGVAVGYAVYVRTPAASNRSLSMSLTYGNRWR